MKTQRLLVALTVANLVLLALNLATRPAVAHGAPDVAPVVRARALEIVDAQGRVRASLAVLPASTSARGDSSRETVLFRLITERGRPSVKIGAAEAVSGLSFAGPTGTRETYVVLQAKGTESVLRLRNEGGPEQVVRPQER